MPSPPFSLFKSLFFSLAGLPLRSLLLLNRPFNDGPTSFSPLRASWQPLHCWKISRPCCVFPRFSSVWTCAVHLPQEPSSVQTKKDRITGSSSNGLDSRFTGFIPQCPAHSRF